MVARLLGELGAHVGHQVGRAIDQVDIEVRHLVGDRQALQQVCAELVGAEHVAAEAPKGFAGSEDFAWMLTELPGCHVLLGNGEGESGGCMVHNPGYDFNDQVLPLGAACGVRLAQIYLVA
jgi:hippurate hydrolase